MDIIDAHTHWGPSLTLLGTTVTSEDLLRKAAKSGVAKIVVFPFPSTAIVHAEINDRLLKEAESRKELIPYYYIPEDLQPIPQEKGFYGGKWHWVKGVQDCSSNYQVLEHPQVGSFIEQSEHIGLPLVFEEELAFTISFVKMTDRLNLIIPHLGMLGGDPLDFLRAFKHNKNVYFDTSLARPSIIMEYLRTIGPERLIFGSDVPFGMMSQELGKIFSLPIGEDERNLILSKNIKGLIRLS